MATRRKTRIPAPSARPDPPVRNVLVLQGGGALGGYQAGVMEGLCEARIEPDWIAGISIGAINAALIAGNPPQTRMDRLRGFWDSICRQPLWPRLPVPPGALDLWPEPWRGWWSRLEAGRAMVEGQQGFFMPRAFPPLLPGAGSPATASWYDTAPLRASLERFVDFDRLNHRDAIRVSVGAVQVDTGNFRYFDNHCGLHGQPDRLGPEHIMASGALPPGFPAVEIEGAYWWDGGLVSNTPLLHVLEHDPHCDLRVFQVDLWSARGPLPTHMADVAERAKDIQFSSRTRMVTDAMQKLQSERRLLQEMIARLPPQMRDDPVVQRAARHARDRRCVVIHLIYRDKPFESDAKDYEFSHATLLEHWRTGLHDLRLTLRHPDWLDLPSGDQAFVTHDVHRKHAEAAAPASRDPA